MESQQFQNAFQSLIDAQVDLSIIDNLDPVFDHPPAVDRDGILALSGYYASQPVSVRFAVKYLYEYPDWKLVGIRVSTQGDPAQMVAQGAPGVPGENPQEPEPEEEASAGSPAGPAFQLAPNEQLKGRLGRLLVHFPEGSNPQSTKIEVFPAGGTQQSAGAYGNLTADFIPGRYDVVISGQRVSGVEVQSRHDTHLLVGVLRVAAGSSTQVSILPGTGEGKSFASAYGNHQFGLPVGSYQVEVAGQKAPVTIKPNTIVDF